MSFSTAKGLSYGLWDGHAAYVRHLPGGTRGRLLLLPGTRFPARATQGVEGGAVSRKEAREWCGQLGPSPLDTAPPSTTVAGQGRKPGAR